MLVLVTSKTLLPILELAREVRLFPDRLPQIVWKRLHRLAADPALIRTGLFAMGPVPVVRTCDRSVLGVLDGFGRTLPCWLPFGEWNKRSSPLRMNTWRIRRRSSSNSAVFGLGNTTACSTHVCSRRSPREILGHQTLRHFAFDAFSRPHLRHLLDARGSNASR